jgi:rod shape-determining protein MreC
VVGVLVLASLVLLTVYFRESPRGGLHRAQGAGSTVLHPFQVGAERIARPFRDAYDYCAGLFSARSENTRLRAELEVARQRYVENESALQENAKLRRLLHLKDVPTYPADYRQVNTRVFGLPPSQFDQQIVVAAGSADGISVHDPVVTAEGLVGEVTKLTPHSSVVTLLTDSTSAVSALDVTSGARGILRHGQGGGDAQILDHVEKAEVVNRGDVIVTAGSESGRLPSIYPRGIPIGTVTSESETDTASFKQIQVDPYVNFSTLDAVAILVSTKPRPRVP